MKTNSFALLFTNARKFLKDSNHILNSGFSQVESMHFVIHNMAVIIIIIIKMHADVE